MPYDILGSSDGPIVGDDLMGEMLGDDLMGDDSMGAQRRQMARQGQPQGLTRPPLFNNRPGMARPAVGRLPLGFGTLTCTSASNPSGNSLTARPQVAWRGSKLVIGISGLNSGNYAVQMRPVIGNRPLLAGAGTVDARAFSATAIDNNLIGDAAAPGIDVSLEFTITPPITTVGDQVILQATWIGDGVV